MPRMTAVLRSPDNSGTGNLEDGSTDTPTEIPQTGEGVAVYPLLLLILSAGGLVLALRLKKACPLTEKSPSGRTGLSLIERVFDYAGFLPIPVS